VVESINTVLFWLVPIFYPFAAVPQELKNVYQYNPLAAIVLATRQVILESTAPSPVLMTKALLVSVGALVMGIVIFQTVKHRFYDHL
jgi:lipopolysaccharide transport system permease protein